METNLSKVLKNGEKRVIGKYRHLVSAVIIGIVKFDKKDYIIFEKRALNIRQGGEISFPGGKYESTDMDTKHTALRETVEELGIECTKIQMLGKFGTLVNPSGVILDVYVAKIDIKDPSEIKYNSDEVEKIIFVPVEFFMENLPRVEKIGLENIPYFSIEKFNLPKRYEKSWSGRAREVYFYSYGGEIIWGITAEIIYEFVKILKKR